MGDLEVESASDDAVRSQRAFDTSCTLSQLEEAHRLVWVVMVAMVAFAILVALLQPELLTATLGPVVLGEIVCAVHLILLSRVRSVRQVLAAHLWMQFGLALANSMLSARLPYLDFFVLSMVLQIFGPLGAYTWRGGYTAVSMLGVPATFSLVHLWSSTEHPSGAVARSVFILTVAAVVGIALMARKYEVQLEAFRSRRALDRAKEELEASMQRLVRTQGELVRSGQLAVLGQLVAAVAHELNTPLGAIRASGTTLTETLPGILDDLPAAVHDFDAVQQDGLHRLLARAAAGSQATSSRQERDLRRRLVDVLDAAGVARARQRARVLAELGIGDALDELLPLLKHADADAVLEQAQALAGLLQGAYTIEVAAARAARIVEALKHHAHPGNADGSPLEASLAENIDTVLILYGSYLKRGIEVDREFVDGGEVEAHHDALNQVWTNLIHNAIQAMAHGGHLTVRVLDAGDDRVKVEIQDDGPGIPEAVQARIFEPFFTTKDAGEGSGLGLSICQDVVSQHGGELAVSSKPGCTVFSVTLPRHSEVSPSGGQQPGT